MEEFVQIKNSRDLYRFRPDDIVFVGAEGNYSNLMLYTGRCYTFTMQLHLFSDIFMTLQNNPFVRVGKSLIVNKNYIECLLLQKKELRLSRRGIGETFRLNASEQALKELKALLEEGESK